LSSFSVATPATTASSLFVAPAALSAFTFAPAAATASAAALSSSAVGASVLRAFVGRSGVWVGEPTVGTGRF